MESRNAVTPGHDPEAAGRGRATVVQLGSGANDTSVFLDALRALAAQMVCIGHPLNFFDIGKGFRPPVAPYLQNVGVTLFFVLSGFLIAHVLVRGVGRPGYNMAHFTIDRVARIYSAYLPALVLIAALDGSLILLGNYAFPQYYTWKGFIGTLVMLQNWQGAFKHVLAVASFGSAGQLWTLGVEFHIYLFVGGVFFALAGRGWPVAAAVAVIVAPMPLAYYTGQAPGTPGDGLFGLWLLGFGSYFVVRAGAGRRLPAAALYTAAVLLSLFWWVLLPPGHEFLLYGYPVLAAAFLAWVLATQRTQAVVCRTRLARVIRLLADYSFSLYLVHYSLIHLCSTLWHGDPLLGTWLSVAASNAIALALAYPTEFRHRQLAGWMRAKLGLEPRDPPGCCQASGMTGVR